MSSEERDGSDAEMPDGMHIDEDMPCIRCGYNLRGLPDEGKCPECGATVEETLNFVLARVLCPACLTPNHPSMPICEKCKAPISGAAATANYYRTVPSPGSRTKPLEEDEPDAPSQGPVMVGWVTGLVVLMFGMMYGATWWSDGDVAVAVGLIGVSIPAAGAMLFFSTRTYQRAWGCYSLALAEYERKHTGAEQRDGGGAEVTDADTDEALG